MRQTFLVAKSMRVHRNADFHVLEIFRRVFDAFATPFSFEQAGAYLPPIIISGGRKKKNGTMSGATETPSSIKVLLFSTRRNLITSSKARNSLIISVLSLRTLCCARRPQIKLSTSCRNISTTWILSCMGRIFNAVHGFKNGCFDGTRLK